MMSQEDKKTRKNSKTQLTKELNSIERYMAEDEVEQVNNRLKSVKEKFRTFETDHEKYHNALEDEKEIEESDDYFADTQHRYVIVLNLAKAWMKSQTEVNNSVKFDANDDRKELFNMVNLPKIELEQFSGDPLKYPSFLATFDEHVHRTRADPSAKLTRLLQYTSGKAKDAIRPCSLIGGEKGYNEARAILERRFGNEFVITESVIRKLKSGYPVESSEDLQVFADELSNCQATLMSLGKLYEVDTQASIVEVMERLPQYLQDRWKRQAMRHKRENKTYPSFEHFVKFVMQETDNATDPVYGSMSSKVLEDQSDETSCAFSANVVRDTKSTSCVACHEEHRLFACETFKSMKPRERLELVKLHQLCRNCLLNNHETSDCRKPSVCSVPGCGEKHTKFIHVNDSCDNECDNSRDRSDGLVNVNQVQTGVECHPIDGVFVPVVHVNVNCKYRTSALLDNGSTSTFCTQRLVSALGLKGVPTNYALSTLDSSNCCKKSKVVNLKLSSLDGTKHLDLSNVYVVNEIPVKNPKINVKCFPHLRDLPIETGDSKIDILIGQDHAEALVPFDVRHGQYREPYATLTLFGWSLNGRTTSRSIKEAHISHVIATD